MNLSIRREWRLYLLRTNHIQATFQKSSRNWPINKPIKCNLLNVLGCELVKNCWNKKNIFAACWKLLKQFVAIKGNLIFSSSHPFLLVQLLHFPTNFNGLNDFHFFLLLLLCIFEMCLTNSTNENATFLLIWKLSKWLWQQMRSLDIEQGGIKINFLIHWME